MVHFYHLRFNNSLHELEHFFSAQSPEHAAAIFTQWLKEDEREENRLQPNKCLRVCKDTDPLGPHTLREVKKEIDEIGILETNLYTLDEVDCP